MRARFYLRTWVRGRLATGMRPGAQVRSPISYRPQRAAAETASGSVANLTRRFCSEKDPPRETYTLAGRYATALCSAAFKEKKLEAVEKELATLKDLLSRDKGLREYFYNPTISSHEKVAAMEELGKKLEFTQLTSNLLVLLAENVRLKEINRVIKVYNDLLAQYRAEVSCQVVTAKPLSDEMKNEIECAIGTFVGKTGKTVVTFKVDPAILGGMTVAIDDKYLDLSVASKIKTYSEILSRSLSEQELYKIDKDEGEE